MPETTVNVSALPVRPMNEVPVTYPRVLPTSLSNDAQIMYRRGRAHHLTHDVFDDTKRNRYIDPAEKKAFVPTERMLTAIAELEDANLASYSSKYGHTLSVSRVDPHYTVATGRGSQLIRVSTIGNTPEDKRLLAVLVGADLESQDSSWRGHSEITLRSRHEDATDVEHDASSTALLTVRQPGMPVFSGHGQLMFHAVLTEAKLYPLGADPLLMEDQDLGEPGQMCTTCETPHPFAPYLPPTVDWLQGPVLVSVEVLPLRPYLVAAAPTEAP